MVEPPIPPGHCQLPSPRAVLCRHHRAHTWLGAARQEMETDVNTPWIFLGQQECPGSWSQGWKMACCENVNRPIMSQNTYSYKRLHKVPLDWMYHMVRHHSCDHAMSVYLTMWATVPWIPVIQLETIIMWYFAIVWKPLHKCPWIAFL